ncbi:MAG: ATP-binding cassette domain-containing protein [Actinobacteria bacterium]|nr:ATP-binding cassette domain-containing protein [Actinomycetota bacterium]
MAEQESVLRLERASVVLSHQHVLQDVDFRLARGEFLVLLGANASGKTTLVKTLLGLIPTASGRAYVFGEPVERFNGWSRIGYVPQRVTAASAVPATVEEVLMSGRASRVGLLGRYGREDRLAVDRTLELVDLGDARRSPVARLSGGQQQRVLIGRALAGEPDVLVLDEPVASVDLAHQESFAGTIEILLRSGTSILMVAHSLGAVARLVQRAVVLERGRVIHDGPPVDLKLEHAHHPDIGRSA